VVAAAATSIVLVLNKSESPTAMAQQAGQSIAPAAGITLAGSYDLTPANLTVTKEGTVEGSYSPQEPDQTVTRITINGVSYVKAPQAFWNLVNGIASDAAQQANGLWAKIPPGDVASFAAFTPAQIARVLTHVGNHPDVVYTTLGQTKVIKLDADGAFYYITTSTPNRLLRIDSNANLGTSTYSFDVTPLTAATIAPVFTALHNDVQALQGAQDPAAFFTNESQINTASDCASSTTSCTVSVNATVTDPGSAAVLVTMTADFSGTKGGAPFGSCNVTVPASTNYSNSGVAVAPTCALTGQAWTGWIESQAQASSTGVVNYWVSATLGVEVNTATDVAALQSALNREQQG
jgi:hypothetical protein